MLRHNSESAWELLEGLEKKDLEKASKDGEICKWDQIMKLGTSWIRRLSMRARGASNECKKHQENWWNSGEEQRMEIEEVS